MMMHPETAHTDMPLAPPTVKDRITIHQTILRLTAIYKTVALAIVLIGVVLWLTIINRILHFGRTLDYSGLEALGIDAALIKQYNPFFGGQWLSFALYCLVICFFTSSSTLVNVPAKRLSLIPTCRNY